MNTEQLLRKVSRFLIVFMGASDNDHYRAVEYILKTLQEYHRLHVEPPPSYVAYVVVQIRMVMWGDPAAMPDAAWAGSEATT